MSMWAAYIELVIYFYFCLLFYGEVTRVGVGGPRRTEDCKVTVIEVHYVKFPNSQ